MYNLEPSDVMELYMALFMVLFKSLPLYPFAHVSPCHAWGFIPPLDGVLNASRA